jgi:hypothetical protein
MTMTVIVAAAFQLLEDLISQSEGGEERAFGR